MRIHRKGRHLTIALLALGGLTAGPLHPGASAAPADVVAHKRSFVSSCSTSHSRPDDPLVFPNSPAASHLHTFLGNTTTDAYSTAESLRAAGATTCHIGADRSAYWVPALYDDGRQIDPKYVRAYYLSGIDNYRAVKPVPPGMGILIKDGAHTWYRCAGNGEAGPLQSSAPTCTGGQHLMMVIEFPDCWDGVRLDSPDHTSHVTFHRGRGCPSSHPVPIAQLQLGLHYTASDGGNVALAPQSSPSVRHADFINAWDQAVQERLVRRCINAGLECNKDRTLTMAA